MRTYINKRPPGFHKVPDQPVIIVDREEEAEVRKPLYAFGDSWPKVRRKAGDILIRHPHFERVAVCSESGEVIRTVNR